MPLKAFFFLLFLCSKDSVNLQVPKFIYNLLDISDINGILSRGINGGNTFEELTVSIMRAKAGVPAIPKSLSNLDALYVELRNKILAACAGVDCGTVVVRYGSFQCLK